MDQRKTISDSELRRVVQLRKQPFEPAFMTEKIMREVRREQERMLRRERRLFFAPVVVATVVLLALGAYAMVHSSQTARTPRDEMASMLLVGFYLLYELQRWLCKKWGLPE